MDIGLIKYTTETAVVILPLRLRQLTLTYIKCVVKFGDLEW
jgi:hypothetical protein